MNALCVLKLEEEQQKITKVESPDQILVGCSGRGHFDFRGGRREGDEKGWS